MYFMSITSSGTSNVSDEVMISVTYRAPSDHTSTWSGIRQSGRSFRYGNYYQSPSLEVIKLEYSLRLKIIRINLLLADTCPQAANHCALF